MKNRILMTCSSLSNGGGPAVFAKALESELSKNFEVRLISRENAREIIKINLGAYKVAILNSDNLLPLLLLLKQVFSSKKTSIIFIMHGEMGKELRPSLKKTTLKICQKMMLKFSDQVIFVSKMFMNDFCKSSKIDPRHNWSVIPNGIDKKSLTPIQHKQNSAEQRHTTLLYAGGERSEKGIELIREIISTRNKIYTTKPKIILLGMSTERAYETENFHVVEKPRMSHSALRDLLRSIDIFISPSKYETFGMALIEAYASGCKVVSFHRAGAIDHIKDKRNLYTFNNYNSESLIEELNNAIKAPRHEIDQASAIPTWGDTSSGYKKIILSLIERASPQNSGPVAK